MKPIIFMLFIAFIFTSCEKTLELKYQDNETKISIEGNITKGNGPHLVKITKSISLSSTATNPTIDDAIVSISDNAGNTEVLSPKGNGIYSSSTIVGVEGRTYILNVKTGNQNYIAESIMPVQVPLDSFKVEEVSFGGDIELNLIPIYTDPIAKGNNYRFVLSVNNKLINQHFIQNDKIKNGFINTFRLEINDNDLKLKSGDLVNITMQCIDQKVALYYTSLALMGDSGPGGGTTPNNPPSNISNGALGLFSAHTTQTINRVLP